MLCSICRYIVQLDDVVLHNAARTLCVCLRCYLKEIGDERRMPKELRREVIATVEAAPNA